MAWLKQAIVDVADPFPNSIMEVKELFLSEGCKQNILLISDCSI